MIKRPTKLLFLWLFEIFDLHNIASVVPPFYGFFVGEKLVIIIEEEVVFLYL